MTGHQQVLDDYVEAYEAARAAGRSVQLPEFVPAVHHPQRMETVIELVRVDLEYNWESGHRMCVEQYQRMFPAELGTGAGLKQVAFEEYRLRRQAGEDIARDNYTHRFAISIEDWPEVPVGRPHAADLEPESKDSSNWLALSRAHPALANRLAAATRQMPNVGDRFESFDLIGELGRGAFGRVFLARQNDLARRFVALKITPQVSEEAGQLAQLQHTNIVPIYSVHRQGPLQAICMPFLGPTTLAHLLKTLELSRSRPVLGRAIVSTLGPHSATTVQGPSAACDAHLNTGEQTVPEVGKSTGNAIRRLDNMSYGDAAVWIMARVADGMACAHDHGIVHRDLKPANILLTDDGEPLVLDFNLAIQPSEEASSVALIGGTLPYMGPEHLAALRCGGSVGPASDVYSLGVILYQLLTGRLPHPLPPDSSDNMISQMIAERSLPPPPIRCLNPSVSHGLAAIVTRCLAVNPHERYPTARGLQQDLQRHLDHQPLCYAPDRSPVERIQKWGRRHAHLASTTTVALASIVIIGLLISAVWSRSIRLAESQARESVHRLASDLAVVGPVLNSPFVDDQQLAAAVHTASAAAELLGVSLHSDLQEQPVYHRLEDDGQRHLRNQAVELLYLLATGKAQQAVRLSAQRERGQRLEQALQDNALASRTFGRQSVPQALTLQRIRLLEAAHRNDEAQRLQQQLDAAPSTEIDRRTLAFEHAQQHRYAEAAELLEQLVVASPRDHTLRFCLGNCYLSLQQYDRSEESFTESIALNPEFTLGYEHRGLARLSAKNYPAARRDFDFVLRRWPTCTSALINRGITQHFLGEPELAAADLTRAIDSGCGQTRLYFLRSRIRKQMGDMAGAAEDFAEGLRRRPSDELSWVALGVARLNEQPHEALADFRQALLLNPRSASAQQNVAHVLSERLNDRPGAIEALDQLLTFDPRNASALAGRGVLLAREGSHEAALRDARAALQADKDPLITYQVGCIHALVSADHQEQQQRALELIAKALASDPRLVDIASQDPDLSLLRQDERIRAILSAARSLREATSES
ncbi:MAG: protein kinase domain-containing protein [Pirellulaceae bacterium]